MKGIVPLEVIQYRLMGCDTVWLGKFPTFRTYRLKLKGFEVHDRRTQRHGLTSQ